MRLITCRINHRKALVLPVMESRDEQQKPFSNTHNLGAMTVWLPLLLLLFVVSSSRLHAQESSASLHRLAVDVLSHHWDRSVESREAMNRFAQRVEATGSTDPQVLYSLGLAQLQLLEYRTAVASFEAAQRRAPDDLAILKALVWGKILTRQPKQATVRLSEIANQIAAKAEWSREDLEFLGCMAGYLSLPLDTSINTRELTVQQRQIEEILSDEQYAIYQAAFDEVRLTFEALEAERTVEREGATEDAERNRDTELENLANEKVELRERATSLDAQIADVNRERNAALGEIRERDAPLQAQWNQAASVVRGLDVRIFDVQQAIWQLSRILAGERDPVLRSRWLFELGRLQSVMDGLQAERISAASFADGIAAQRTALANQYASVQHGFDVQLNQLGNDRQNVRRRETIADSRTRRLQGPLRVVSGRADSYGREARSLSTYYEFPLESERLRIVAEFTSPAAPGSIEESPLDESPDESDSLILGGDGG